MHLEEHLRNSPSHEEQALEHRVCHAWVPLILEGRDRDEPVFNGMTRMNLLIT